MDSLWLLSLELDSFSTVQKQRLRELVNHLISEGGISESECYLHLDEEVLRECDLIDSVPVFKRRQNRIRTKLL